MLGGQNSFREGIDNTRMQGFSLVVIVWHHAAFTLAVLEPPQLSRGMRSSFPLVVFLLGVCNLVTSLPHSYKSRTTNHSLHDTFFPGLLHGLSNKISNLLGKNEIYTPFGPIKGIETDGQGVIRYAVRYATVDERWAEARPTEWGIESLK